MIIRDAGGVGGPSLHSRLRGGVVEVRRDGQPQDEDDKRRLKPRGYAYGHSCHYLFFPLYLYSS